MSIRDQGLQNWPSQVEKVKQLYNQILVRHGVMLIGPTGGGKTTVRSILQRALVLMPALATEDSSKTPDGSVTRSRQQSALLVGNRSQITAANQTGRSQSNSAVQLGKPQNLAADQTGRPQSIVLDQTSRPQSIATSLV